MSLESDASRASRGDSPNHIPGAGYDGDLSGGVIDIITKRKFESQVTGSVGVTGNTRRQYGGNGYIATQLGKVSLQGNVLFSDQTGYTERWGLERVALSETKNHRFEQDKERVYDRNSAPGSKASSM